MRIFNKILDVATIIILSIALFIVCRAWAEFERGYAAIGGEYIVLIAPLLVYVMRNNLKKSFEQVKNERNGKK